MHSGTNTTRCLGIFQLVMIAIVSVDSLRNIPIGAQYGLSLVTFYLFAGLAFFLPLAWVTSKLAVKFPNVGGSYLWIESAFGKSMGYLSIWLQWTYNIIWYPTIFAFISGTVASLVFPGLETNRWFILMTCAGLFWGLTYLHSFGMRASSWVSTFTAIIGTLLPMLFLIGFGCYWVLSDFPTAIPLTMHSLLPDAATLKNSAYFSNILFSLLGLEVIAMHAGNVKDPSKTYPKGLLISAVLILTTLILSSLSLCLVIPPAKLMLITGVMDVFKLFFTKYHLSYGVMIMGWCIVIGGLGIASSWMIGLARGLHVALLSTNAPAFLQQLNKHGVPLNVLCFQGVVYTLLLSAFLLLPNVNSSYWILSAMAAQFALLYYIILFSAAFTLLQSIKQSKWQTFFSMLLPISAGVVSVIGIAVGFLPPSNIAAGNVIAYELFMVVSIIIFCVVPFLVLRRKGVIGNS